MRRVEQSEALRANLEERLANAAEKREFMLTSGVIMAGGGPSPVKMAAMSVTSTATQTSSSAPVSPAKKRMSSPSPSPSHRSGGSARGIRRVSESGPGSTRAHSAPKAGAVFRPPSPGSPYLRGTAAADHFPGSAPPSPADSHGSFAPDKFSLVCN